MPPVSNQISSLSATPYVEQAGLSDLFIIGAAIFFVGAAILLITLGHKAMKEIKHNQKALKEARLQERKK